MNLIKKLSLYVNTLRYLRLNQIYHYVQFYIKKNLLNRWYIKDVSTLHTPSIPSVVALNLKPSLKNAHNLSRRAFLFLNKRISYPNKIDWNDCNQSKLWLYNLHYFDYLISDSQDESKLAYPQKKKIIKEWINYNPIGYGNGWESYPLSLRIVNWIFFYHYNYQFINQDSDFKNTFIKSLYSQGAYLSRHIEFHIGANHLLKNAKAIYITGLFFGKEEWLLKGRKIFDDEIKEQILPDGGHFELSPMYHSIVIEDVLDVLNFRLAYEPSNQNSDIEYLKDLVTNMLEWLHKVMQPDGDIPLFGDSAFKISLTFSQLNHYYQNLFGSEVDIEKNLKIESLDASGYYIFRTKDQYLIIDGGKLGVDYQPGHAHGDIFSYEYSYKGRRFIVDSGPGEYMDTQLRHKARSINGHNTLNVNGLEPAQIWKSFRMGRRIKHPKIKVEQSNNEMSFEGIYKNNLSRIYSFQHRREIKFIEEKYLLITEYVDANKLKSCQSIIHPNPECEMEINEGDIQLTIGDDVIFILYNEIKCDIYIEDWFYTPEFGKKVGAKKIGIFPKSMPAKTIFYMIVPMQFIKTGRDYFSNLE